VSLSPPPESGPVPGAARDVPGPLAADPDPEVAGFVADLRALRASAGAPSYERLAKSAGLARSTLHDGLRGNRLPSLEVTLGVVRACGGSEQQWRERWTTLRQRLDVPRPDGVGGRDDSLPAAEPAPEQGSAAEPAPEQGVASGRARRRPRRGMLAAAAMVLLAAGAGTAVVSVADRGNDGCASARLYRAERAGAVLDADGHPVGRVDPGDTVRVRSLAHDRFAHRYYGTVERTHTSGYLDEAKLTFVRQVCG
jgi:hypothetical protein